MNVSNKQPYPKIKVEKKSKELAQLLSHVYASNEGELTAIHLYVYQSIILKEKNEELSQLLIEISKVEMHHLFLLGQTITKLGNPPIYADCTYGVKYWDSNEVYYDMDTKTMLEIDIESEKQAIQNYHLLLLSIEDIYVKSLIERIILDEEIHLEIFCKLYQKYA